MPFYFRVDIDPEDLGMVVIAEYIDDVSLGGNQTSQGCPSLFSSSVDTEKCLGPGLCFPRPHHRG
jgi:hypothetical protein